MTAMSSRRTFESFAAPRAKKAGHTGLPVLVFLVGLALLAAGIYANISVLAIIGFVPFTATLLYWNAMFWSRAAGDKMFKDSWRHFPY